MKVSGYRALVQDFANQMYLALRQGERKYGHSWLKMHKKSLLRRLFEEIAEAVEDDSLSEWIDVANIAMFLAYRKIGVEFGVDMSKRPKSSGFKEGLPPRDATFTSESVDKLTLEEEGRK